MIDFEDLPEAPARPTRMRVRAVWLWLFVGGCFVALAAVLYFQYGVWVHPIHEPTDLDLVEMDLQSRLGTPIEIISSETVQDVSQRPLLRVKYRQQTARGTWLPGDRVYRIEEGKILWGRDYQFWRWEVD
jgi:hypothetical protein